jgi:hypothetical protein
MILSIDSFDKALMLFGTIGAISEGVVMPAFSLIFGQILDALNDPGVNFMERVDQITVYFVYAGLGSFVATTGRDGN